VVSTLRYTFNVLLLLLVLSILVIEGCAASIIEMLRRLLPRTTHQLVMRSAILGQRNMGILDKVKSAFDTTRFKSAVDTVRQDKTEKKKSMISTLLGVGLFTHIALLNFAVELYQMQLEAMAKMTTYTLRDYVNNLIAVADKAGLNDWRSWLRSTAQQAELDEQWIDIKIAQALEPVELEDPSLLRRREKMRISTTAGCDVSRVNRFIDNFEQSRQVHKWMQSRKSRGLPMPKTMEEYLLCMSSDRSGMSKEAMTKSMGRVRSRAAMVSRGP
jgi:signal recognition particle GTPase